MPPFVLAVLIIPSFHVVRSYFCFTQFCDSSLFVVVTLNLFSVVDLLTFTYTSRSCSRLTDSIFFSFFSQYHGSSGRLLIRFFIFDVFLKSFCSGEDIWQVKWGHVFTSSLREDFLTLTSLGLPPSQELFVSSLNTREFTKLASLRNHGGSLCGPQSTTTRNDQILSFL